jgi:hypothetical protein
MAASDDAGAEIGGTMLTLTLPQLVAGRELAAEAVAKLGALADASVVVDARPLVSGSTSFASQLVRSTLVDGHAAELTVVGGPAERLDVADHLKLAADDADLGVRS